jgi:hypothetical protein
MAAAKITDAELETTFPSIATEDRTAKLQDLSFCEANNWISKETAGTIAAKEMGINSYDFQEEQSLIADEFAAAEDTEEDTDAEVNPITGKKPDKPKQGDGTIRRPMIIASNRQAPKLDPTKSIKGEEVEAPGLVVPFAGTDAAQPGASPAGGTGQPQAPGGAKAPQNGQPKSRAGFPAKENPMSAAGANSIRQDNALTEATVTLTHEELLGLLREARKARRTPDDPDHAELVQQFREQTTKNLAALVRDAVGQS